MSRRLEGLPVELLLHLLQYLPTSSLISLKLSSKQLFSTLPLPPLDWRRTAPLCEIRAGTRYIHERKDAEYGRRTCVLCGAYDYPGNPKVDAPICKAHEGLLMVRTVPKFLEPELKTRLEASAKNMPCPVWVSLERNICAHRKLVENWNDTERTCNCGCDSCGHWPVKCYIRVAYPHPGYDKQPISFRLAGDAVIERRSIVAVGYSLAGYEWDCGIEEVVVPVTELSE